MNKKEKVIRKYQKQCTDGNICIIETDQERSFVRFDKKKRLFNKKLCRHVYRK